MLECTYTKDKIKKAKSWKDGYIILRDNKIHLFDEERKKIYCSTYKYISEEISLPMYLIYCEKINRNVESEEEPVIKNPIPKKQTRFLHPETNVKKYISPVKKKFESVKERITDDGIILIDDGCDVIDRSNTTQKKVPASSLKNDSIFRRTREQILDLIEEIK